MFLFLTTLWFIRTAKWILFWIYLWQLKEYHTGRFRDHFRTEKGKRLLGNKIFIFKLFLLVVFLPQPVLVFFLATFLYIFETIKTFFDLFRGRTRRPVLTKKAIFLVFAGLLSEALFIFLLWFLGKNIVFIAFLLLIFDVLTPVIVSLIVLFFQPLAVFGRNQIIKKAKLRREQFKDLLVIGITGSYGKTSTKEFLATILAEKFKILKTKEHQNSEVGISQCILKDLNEEHEIFICEMGAYNKGGIKLLCDIAKPKIGILTGINEQHLATFGSLENIIKTKYELIESLPADGTAFFNENNRYSLELYEKTLRRGSGQAFLYGREAGFPGEENILGAMAVAKELGMTEEEIKRAVARIENRFPGIQVKKACLPAGREINITVIDATYSANPDGTMAHLEYLKTLRRTQGKLVIVMPCLIELGKASGEIHKKIGKKIGEVCDLAIITTKDRFEEIRDGAKGSLRRVEIIFIEEPKEILEKIKSFAQEGDVVLLESRLSKHLIKQLILDNQ